MSVPVDQEQQVLDRLRMLPPARLPAALDALQERGLLQALDSGPVGRPQGGGSETPRLDQGVPDRLSLKQRSLHRLLQDDQHAAFYQCAQLWWAPAISAESLLDAWDAVAPGYECLRTDVDLGADRAVLTEVDVVRASLLSVPPAERTSGHGAEWVTAHAEQALGAGLAPSDRSVHATVFDAGRDGSWLLVHGRDLMLDQQGLQQILGPALDAWLAGGRPRPAESLRPSDIADWQAAGLRDGLLGLRVAARGRRLAGTPTCPLPVRGNRSGRRAAVPVRAGIADIQQASAAAKVSIAAWSLAAWQRAIAIWLGTDDFAIGCCSTLRLLPELQATLGNLTNTVIVPPLKGSPDRPVPDSIRDVQSAFSAAIGGVDEPFEAVLASIPGATSAAGFGSAVGVVEDETIGFRFTFTEHVEDQPMLQSRPVRSGYAKSVLSAEVERRGDRLVAFIDHRPAVSPAAAARLATLFGQSLTP